MNNIGHFEIKPFSKYRKNVMLIAHEGWRRHSLHTLIEADVTESMKKIKRYKDRGRDISFTAWVIKCLSRSLEEYKDLNVYRLGRRKLVTFDDVDVGIPIEKEIEEEKIPMGYIIRKANRKSLDEITREIRDAQREKGRENQVLIKDLSLIERLVLKSPVFIKKIVLGIIRNRGIFKKKYIGTVGVTSIGMFSRFSGWMIPVGGINSLLVAINGITKKPGVVNEKIEIRDYLHMIVTLDHDLTDGAVAGRFISYFVKLLEEGFGIEE